MVEQDFNGEFLPGPNDWASEKAREWLLWQGEQEQLDPHYLAIWLDTSTAGTEMVDSLAALLLETAKRDRPSTEAEALRVMGDGQPLVTLREIT